MLVLSATVPPLNFNDWDLYWTHALFKGRLKLCCVSVTARGKDIKVSLKVLCPFVQFSSGCITKSRKHEAEEDKGEISVLGEDEV